MILQVMKMTIFAEKMTLPANAGYVFIALSPPSYPIRISKILFTLGKRTILQ